MDMTNYAGKRFLKLDDAAAGPFEENIADVAAGSFDKAELTFESGARLSLNKTNTSVLVKAFGRESRDWIGKRIEIFEGMLPYKGSQQPGLRVRAINPPALKPSDGGDF
jgi:hypothetical protein